MTAPDIGTMRDAIQARLATLPAPLRAYDVFDENVTLPQAVVVYPKSPAREFWLGHPSCSIVYNFTLEIYVDCQAGSVRAQNTMDAFLSPTGTNTNSIEGCLESRTTADDLTTYTTSVKVDPFTSYGFRAEGVLVAAVPVEVFCDNS